MLKGNTHTFLFCVFLLIINDNVIKSNEKEGVHSHVSGYKHINYFYFVCFFRTNVIYCLTLWIRLIRWESMRQVRKGTWMEVSDAVSVDMNIKTANVYSYFARIYDKGCHRPKLDCAYCTVVFFVYDLRLYVLYQPISGGTQRVKINCSFHIRLADSGIIWSEGRNDVLGERRNIFKMLKIYWGKKV